MGLRRNKMIKLKPRLAGHSHGILKRLSVATASGRITAAAFTCDTLKDAGGESSRIFSGLFESAHVALQKIWFQGIFFAPAVAPKDFNCTMAGSGFAPLAVLGFGIPCRSPALAASPVQAQVRYAYKNRLSIAILFAVWPKSPNIND
jgi:hypothetical protein